MGKLKIIHSEVIKMNRGDKEEKKGTRGELEVEANLEFVVSLQEQPVLELKGKHRYRNPERICDFCFKYEYETVVKYETFFKLHFAIKGKDGIYPFQIELYQNHDTEYYDDIYFFLDVCPIGDHPDYWLEQKIEFTGGMYDKSFQKEGCSSNFGRNGPSEHGMTSFMSDYMFQLNEEELGGWDTFKLPSKCNIKISMKIYSLKTKGRERQKITKEDEAGTLLQFLKSNEASFKIICPTDDGNKEYFIDENLIAKESDVLEALISGRWAEGQSKEMTLKDTDYQTLESVLVFCNTKALTISAINEDLATFVDMYNLENLMDLMDRFISMSLSTIEDKTWIIKWTPKLKMTRTALKLVKFLRREAKIAKITLTKSRKDFASYIYNGSPTLTWAEACKGNKELATYLSSLTEIKESFPKYSDLKCSENIMIISEQEDDWPDDESVLSRNIAGPALRSMGCPGMVFESYDEEDDDSEDQSENSDTAEDEIDNEMSENNNESLDNNN